MLATARHTTAQTVRPDGGMVVPSQAIQPIPFRLPDEAD